MNDDEFRQKLIDALQFIGGGQLHGPSGLEGLAMSIAGQALGSPLAEAVHAVAEALNRIADALEENKL